MKKVISLILVVLTLFSVMSIGVSAADIVALCKSGEHEWFEVDRQSATCTRAGVKYYNCKKCVLGVKQETYADPLAHKDDDHNGLCDVCKTDTTLGCNCLCHKVKAGRESILSPLASLVQIFRIIFKINHYCKCGYHEIHKR